MESGRSPPRVVVARSIDEYLRSRAASLIGSLGGPQFANYFFDDLSSNINNTGLATGWQWTPTNSGNLAWPNDEAGGVQEVVTGGTAASRGQNKTLSPFVRAGGTVSWYCAFRSKLTTGVTAQTKALCGLVNAAANATIAAGFFGALNASNFVAQYDGNEAGSSIDLGVAVDTAYHVFELWCLGDSKLHCAIDFGADKAAAGGTTMASAPTDALNGIRAIQNGTDAVGRTMRNDWFAMLAKRN